MKGPGTGRPQRLARWTFLLGAGTLLLVTSLSWYRLQLGAGRMLGTELVAVAGRIEADLERARQELLQAAAEIAARPTTAVAGVPALSPATTAWVDSLVFAVVEPETIGTMDPMFAAALGGRSVADLRRHHGTLWMEAVAPVSPSSGSVGVLRARLRFPRTFEHKLLEQSLAAALLLEGRVALSAGSYAAPFDWSLPAMIWSSLKDTERPLVSRVALGQQAFEVGLAPWKDFDSWEVTAGVAVFSLPERAVPAAALSPVALAAVLAGLLILMMISCSRLLKLRLAGREPGIGRRVLILAGMVLPLLVVGITEGLWAKTVASDARQRLAVWAEPTAGPASEEVPVIESQALLAGAGRQVSQHLRVTLVWLAALWLLAAVVLGATGFVARNLDQPGRLRRALLGYAFLSPSALHLLVFSLGPVLFALYISFHNWGLMDPVRPYVGLGNYLRLLHDPDFWNSVKNTAVYTLHVPVGMAMSLAIAMLVNQRLPGVHLLRTIFFLPSVTSFVAIAMIWQWIYNPDFGLLNWALSLVRLGPFPWLNDPSTALLSLMLLAIWIQAGYQMVIFLAGLQGIPQYLYDAAIVDGASRWQRFRRITLPMLRPTTFFVLVTSVIGSFQVFTQVYVMTEGGPLKSTEVIVYHIYKNAWEYLRMGYASAMSWVLFAIVMGITLIQFRYLGKRVEYY